MDKDFYKRMGVSRSASQDEVRKAYRKLAHQYHPDKTGGDKVAEAKLKEINQAYDVLKNKEKRAKYDQFGEDGAQMGQGRGAGGASPFDDIFDAFFAGGAGGRSRAQTAAMGNDLEYRVGILLKEAASGTKKTVRFSRKETCGDCSGSGAAKGSSAETCRQCGGQGQVRMAQGFFSISRPCPVCHGVGQLIKDPCRRCRGEGQVKMERELSVDLPAGVDTGSRLCLRGEGEPGRNGGARGDLYIFVEVKPDDLFEREGNDIICEVPVSFPQVILGATIRVPTLNGEAELKIPAGTQSGTLFKLRGMGIPDIRGYRQGDQIVEIQVETPTKLSRDQKELIKSFDGLSDTKTYPLHRRFLKRIRESFGG